jgi:hypothetical protein
MGGQLQAVSLYRSGFLFNDVLNSELSLLYVDMLENYGLIWS